MRRAARWMAWSLVAVLALPVFALLLSLAAANSQAGQAWITRTVSGLGVGEIRLSGLSGRFPDALRLARLELHDRDGLWFSAERLALDWSPTRLLAGVARIDRLQAGHIAWFRQLAASSEPEPASGFSLPVGVVLARLQVERLDLAQPVAGRPARLAIVGSAHVSTLQRGEADLTISEVASPGRYVLQASLADGAAHARLSLREPAQGLLGSFAGIEELDALSLEAKLDGPLSAMASQIDLDFGPFHARLQGGLDLERDRFAALAVTATAPAMRPRPGLSWQAVALDAHLDGLFSRPVAQGRLRVERLEAAGVAVRAITLDAEGDAGRVGLTGELVGLSLPGPQPGLLEAAPLGVKLDAQLEAPGRPVGFAVRHPLFSIEGKADTADAVRAEALLRLPDLKPFTALAGLDARGKAAFNLRLAQQDSATKLEADGSLSITGGSAPLPGLLGDAAKLAVSAEQRGSDLKLSRLSLDGKALGFSADGSLLAGKADFNWKLAFKDLAALAQGVSGKLAAQGRLSGPPDKLSLTADVDGELAARELPRGPLSAKLRLDGLPKSATGQVVARGLLAGAPVELAVAAQAPAGGPVRIAIERADWKSLHGQGGVSLVPGAGLPVGKVELHMAKLEDLRPLLGQPLVGSLAATLETTAQAGRLRLDLREAGLPAQATVGHASLDLAAKLPLDRPTLDGRLDLEGISAAGLGGSARLDLAGPVDALALRLDADAQTKAGAMRLDAAAKLDAPGGQLALSALRLDWRDESLRLLAPARLSFAQGVAVERLRLGLREAVLDLDGQLSPRLDLDASLRQVSADWVALAVPGLAVAGSLQAEAKLGGTLAKPTGRVAFGAEGLRMKTSPGRALPVAKLAATADLDGASAHVDARVEAGSVAHLALRGAAPFAADGLFDLHASGAVDLKLLDPLLAAEGRRLRGQLTLDGGLAGSLSAPRLTGSARLADGEAQDHNIGAQLTDISALLEADGGTVRIAKLEGKAGPGRFSASGELDMLAEGMPLNLSLDARNARPLASDRLTVNLDANLALRGQAEGALAAVGAVHIKRAEIRIPERLPTGVAVLKVIRPGEAPPPPPAPARDIALDLLFDAPDQIFVRGRGLEAELGGKVHVRGTAGRPQPDGGFAMRRGQFSLAGQTLVFSTGEVGFDGGSLADPSLNFLAKTTSASVTASLAVGGTASKPKISLSSTPELPQDEVLAQLLFGRASANLSPLEMARIAQALASLSGVTFGAGDTLDSLRKTLGLDRLSVGANLEAGRYLVPGVYVGAKQGITGANTQATVQVDIAKGLKLEAAVGTGAPASGPAGASGGNSVGVIYQYEY